MHNLAEAPILTVRSLPCMSLLMHQECMAFGHEHEIILQIGLNLSGIIRPWPDPDAWPLAMPLE